MACLAVVGLSALAGTLVDQVSNRSGILADESAWSETAVADRVVAWVGSLEAGMRSSDR